MVKKNKNKKLVKRQGAVDLEILESPLFVSCFKRLFLFIYFTRLKELHTDTSYSYTNNYR